MVLESLMRGGKNPQTKTTLNISREANIGVIFLLGGLLLAVGLLAVDLRVLAFVGAPVAVTCLVLSRAKLALASGIFGLASLRFLFILLVTGESRMLLGFVLCAGAALALLRIAAARESAATSSDRAVKGDSPNGSDK
jgi:hypothetical protein